MEINGVPIGQELKKFAFDNVMLNNVDGSCMIVVITDAPLDSRNLERVAKGRWAWENRWNRIQWKWGLRYCLICTQAEYRSPI